MRWLVLAALTLGFTRSAHAEDVLFYWADKQNVVHATQNLDEVPEPYRAMYRARLKELEEAKKKQPAVVQPVVPNPAAAPVRPKPSVVDQELARQKQWRDEVARWRNELRLGTEDLQRIQSQIDEININPVLRMTPQATTELEPLEQKKKAAVARIDVARRMLTQDLPARAKRDGVPPRYLD